MIGSGWVSRPVGSTNLSCFGTIPSMLTRRDFTGLVTASLAMPGLGSRMLGQTALTPSRATAPKTSVMMWTLNKGGSFEQNLERVAEAGYDQVELVSEFKSWSPADMTRILARMKAIGIRVDAMAGMTLGFADPAGGDAFLSELKTLIPVASRLGCRQIILLSGKRIVAPVADSESDRAVQHAASIETLKRAADLLSAANIQGVIEPIDRLENPTIYLDGVTEAFAIVKAVDSPFAGVLYDLYHEQRSHGNLIEKLQQNVALVGLIHVADVPGRHQPGSGELNYGNIYRTLARLNYTGTIAMEFYPTGDVVTTLRDAREQVLRCFDPRSTMQ
jgi:hydroxypyruvate isomerase